MKLFCPAVALSLLSLVVAVPVQAEQGPKPAAPVRVAVDLQSQTGNGRLERDLVKHLIEGLGKELDTEVQLADAADADTTKVDAAIAVWYEVSPKMFDVAFVEAVHAKVDGRVLNVTLPPSYGMQTRSRWSWAGTQVGRDIGVVLKRTATREVPIGQEGLIAQLSDRDPVKRAAAADQVGRLGPDAREAVPALLAMLDDHRSLHVIGSGQATTPSAVAARALLLAGAHTELVSFFRSKGDDRARSIVLTTIAGGKIAGASDLVLGALDDQSRSVRTTAAWLAGRYVGRAAVPRLIEIVDQFFFIDLREAAHRSLVDISGQDFKLDANAWRAWWSARQGN